MSIENTEATPQKQLRQVLAVTACVMLLSATSLSNQTRRAVKTTLPGVRLMHAGEFHGDEIDARTGEVWLGLYDIDSSHFLRPSRITVKPIHDPILDDDENAKSGKAVSVNQKDEPVLLVRGISKLRPGPVKTVLVTDRNLSNNTDVELSLAGMKYRVTVITNDRNPVAAISSDDAKLVLTNGSAKQVLYDLGGNGDPLEVNWKLLWAGDLDGDEKLDLYIDASNHYNVAERRLFLSSYASLGSLVKQVAVFRTVGC